MVKRVLMCAVSLLVAGLSLPAGAQGYPAKPVRFLVGFT
ncbi:MAG: hypothetical protein JWN13_2091, partial [Betaproteobacteria bacterium]|nr:hypothetical protein [Betaproteobacteria bacterium]